MIVCFTKVLCVAAAILVSLAGNSRAALIFINNVKGSLPFNGAVTGASFQIGNQIVGPAPFSVFLDAGLGNPGQIGGDPLAVIGSDRFLTITAAPEPSSLALLALSGFPLAFRLRSRRSLNPTQRIPDLGDSSNESATQYTCNRPSHSRI